MRRIAGLAFGLMLVAGTVQAQKPVIVAKADSIGTATGKVALKDSMQYQVRWCARTTKGVGITASGHCTTLTLPWWIKAKPVPPPIDTTKPPVPPDTVTPPVDTTPKPTPAGVLFSSEWRNGPTDGGKWERASCQGSSISTIAATGLGFPAGMTNVLHVRMGLPVNGGTNCDWVQAHNKWSVPAIGKAIAFRIYARQGVPDSDGDKGGGYAGTHPVESGYNAGTGGGFWEWKLGSFANGTFPLEFETSSRGFSFGAPSGPGGHPAALKKFVTYRWEWKFTRVAASRYDVDLRIYGPDGALLFDKSNIYEWGGSASVTLATLGNNLPIDDDQVQNFRVGINGGFAAGATAFVDYGGAAVCTDWCGAY